VLNSSEPGEADVYRDLEHWRRKGGILQSEVKINLFRIAGVPILSPTCSGNSCVQEATVLVWDPEGNIMMPKSLRSGLVAALPLMVAVALPIGAASAEDLKSYDSSKPSFWAHPPADWFLGDETEAQKGLARPAGPATPTPVDELRDDLKKIKLPPGFKIAVYASGIPEARQMAWAPTERCLSGRSMRRTFMPLPIRADSAVSRPS
jgi:hypothetical protein